MYSITLKDYLGLAFLLGLFMVSGIDVEGIKNTYVNASVTSVNENHDTLFSEEYKAYERRYVYNYQKLREK